MKPIPRIVGRSTGLAVASIIALIVWYVSAYTALALYAFVVAGRWVADFRSGYYGRNH